MHPCAQITERVVDAAKRGEIDLDPGELALFEKILDSFSTSEDLAATQFRELLTSRGDLARASARVLGRAVQDFCERELARYEELKAIQPLNDADKTYVIGTLFPLYDEALRLAVRVGQE
jgi:hypothetical protein